MKTIGILFVSLVFAAVALGEPEEKKEIKIDAALSELSKGLASQSTLLKQMLPDLPKAEQLYAISRSGECETIAMGLVILKNYQITMFQSPKADPEFFNGCCDLLASHSRDLAANTAGAIAKSKSPGFLDVLREIHKLLLAASTEAKGAKR